MWERAVDRSPIISKMVGRRRIVRVDDGATKRSSMTAAIVAVDDDQAELRNVDGVRKSDKTTAA